MKVRITGAKMKSRRSPVHSGGGEMDHRKFYWGVTKWPLPRDSQVRDIFIVIYMGKNDIKSVFIAIDSCIECRVCPPPAVFRQEVDKKMDIHFWITKPLRNVGLSSQVHPRQQREGVAVRRSISPLNPQISNTKLLVIFYLPLSWKGLHFVEPLKIRTEYWFMARHSAVHP